jgi:uncharacterized protein (TIGR00730 family)
VCQSRYEVTERAHIFQAIHRGWVKQMSTKAITIFGSSSIQEDSAAWKQAFEVGKRLAEAEFTVINGGYDGSMRATHKGAKQAGGQTVGITTNEFSGSEKNEFVDKEVRAPRWHERLYELMSRGDGFIVLDGGTGTLVELIVYWEMANKHFHEKPAAVLGKLMREAVKDLEKNSEVKIPKSLKLVSTAEEAVRYLKEALP